jgi:hypothetical protein
MPCSLCESNDAPYSEQRNSGPNGEKESWHYCRECWREHQGQQADTDPFICQKYVIFLQYFNGYRMQRIFNGNRASRLMP